MSAAWNVLMGAAVLLPRPLFNARGGWDEGFTFGGEDLEFSMRIGQAGKIVYLPQAEIIHYGRVSSRLHNGFAISQLAIGLVRYMRKAGHSRLSMLGYKTAVMLDAPLQLATKLLQSAWRLLLGQRAAANRSWLAACGTCHFLTRGLIPFWRA